MKPKTIQQEILFFAGISFFNREFYLNEDGSKKTTGYFPMEHLEKACWAGMLFELLPGLVDCPSAGYNTYIWQILNGDHFLRICLGSDPVPIEKEVSIDPYSFLSSVFFS